MLSVIMMLSGSARDVLGQVNTFPWPNIGRIGIGTYNPQKKLNVHAALPLTYQDGGDPTIRLSYHTTDPNAINFIYAGHLALLTPTNNTFYGMCYDYSLIRPFPYPSGPYTLPIQNATSGDLILQAGEPPTLVQEGNYGDLILTTLSPSGYIRLATTEPADGTNRERLTMLPDGRIGINTTQPVGTLDINLKKWNCGTPKISFSAEPSIGCTSDGPSIRLYRAIGDDGDCPNVNSFAWWIENASDPNVPYQSALRFRVGTKPGDPNDYQNLINTELPITRMKIMSNGDVGINQEAPATKFQVSDGAVLFDGNIGGTPKKWVNASYIPGIIPCTFTMSLQEIGAGTRMMWIPEKGAFRAGTVASFYPYDLDGDRRLDDDSPNDPEPGFIKATGWNNPNIGYHSFAFGYNSRARGMYDIAMGMNNVSNSGEVHGAITLGHVNKSTGVDAIAIGFHNSAEGANSFCAGMHNKSLGESSMVLGHSSTASGKRAYILGEYCDATADKSIFIGFGTETSRFLQDKTRSVKIGVESEGIYVSSTASSTPVCRVGIGTAVPQNTLGINGDVVIGWNGSQTISDANTSLVVENKVGIGTASPTEAVSLIGGSAIIWNDAAISVASNVDLAVRQKVVIGRNTVIAPGEDNYPDQATLLHVAGRAIKNDGDGEWDNPSDENLKKEIEPYQDGLTQLRNVHPVWYKYKNEWGLTDTKRNIGILAQDIASVMPYTVREDTLKLTKILKNEKRYEVDAIDTIAIQVVDYTQPEAFGHYKHKDSIVYKPVKRLIIEPTESVIESNPILVFNGSALKYLLINAVKELDTALYNGNDRTLGYITTLQEQNIQFQTQKDSLQRRVEELEARLRSLELQTVGAQDPDILLEQNRPNPFSEITIISYYIPASMGGTIELVIASTDAGTIFQRHEIDKGTPSQIEIDAHNLEKGVYLYGVAVNGVIRASKKMMILK